jgi:LruC domain-containing protein
MNTTNRTLLLCLTLLGAALAANPARAATDLDTDADGVPDGADPFPCDPTRTAVVFVPSEFGRGTLLFEDNWPARGDLDFNDAVVAYNVALFQDGRGLTSGLRLTVTPRAIGAKIENGLALRLPVPRATATRITRAIGAQPAADVAARGDDAELVIDLSANLREAYPGLDGFVNTLAEAPSVGDGATIVVEVSFAPAVYLDVAADPFDLFFFRAADPGHEVHRPMFDGTARMNRALFGTADDASNTLRRFVDADGLPFVLTIPDAQTWPRERVRIERVWPRVVAFAASGGADAGDFYTSIPAAGTAFPAAAAGPLAELDFAACVPASCTDGVMNGDEAAPDCGGVCASGRRPTAACQTALLLHFDGASGSTDFVDETGKPVAATGAVQLVNAPSRFGGAAYFDGNSELVLASHPDFDFGTGDFTVEYWLQEVGPQTVYEGVFDLDGPDRLLVAVGNFMIYPAYRDGYLQLDPTRFEHFAITRQGHTIRAFRQGRLTYEACYAGAVGSLSSVLHIGLNLNNGEYLSGYLDELRIVKGTAIYTSAFSPERVPFERSARCGAAGDCTSGVCAGGCCVGAHCNDGLQNGDETDLDCGGATNGAGACAGCAPGRRCDGFLDCASGVCTGGVCQASGDILSLRFEGAEGSTTFVDDVGRTVRHRGGGGITTARSRSGGGSGYFDGTTVLEIPIDQGFDMHTEDFTVEFWFSELAPQTTYEGMVYFGQSHAFNQAVGAFLISPLYADPYLVLEPDVWTHFAVVRRGDVLAGFRNGVAVWQQPYAGQVGDAVGSVFVGYNPNNGDYMTGYMDDLRITKGVARYLPPSAP